MIGLSFVLVWGIALILCGWAIWLSRQPAARPWVEWLPAVLLAALLVSALTAGASLAANMGVEIPDWRGYMLSQTAANGTVAVGLVAMIALTVDWYRRR